MAARSVASVFLTFGLVSIPVKVYSATQSSAGISFNLLHKTDGSRLKQQYVCVKENVPVDRADMVKGYEFAKDQYVMFTAEELKALEEKGTHTIDIIAFIPVAAIDPIYYEKAYYLAPDKGGTRPYSLLIEGMRETGRCALAKWPWKGKQYMVQIRASGEGLILQQLMYADEVRPMKELEIETTEVKRTELDLAIQLIEQISADSYDASAYEDEVKKRIEAAVNQKVEGKEVVVSAEPEAGGGQVIDLMEALRASLAKAPAPELKERKPAKRVPAAAAAPAPVSRGKSKKSG
jgi:DNA end-binding protein Ku